MVRQKLEARRKEATMGLVHIVEPESMEEGWQVGNQKTSASLPHGIGGHPDCDAYIPNYINFTQKHNSSCKTELASKQLPS
jgi:hypothetical protein